MLRTLNNCSPVVRIIATAYAMTCVLFISFLVVLFFRWLWA